MSIMFKNYVENEMFIREFIAKEAEFNILYIHGLGESGLCFLEFINKNLKTMSHFVVDLPGYGKSSWQKQPLTMEEHADNIANWLQSRKIENVVVCGHSMGGVVGLILCEKYPGLMKYFANVEGNISIEDCGFSKKMSSYTCADFIDHGFERIISNVYKNGLKDKPLQIYYPSLRFCDLRALHLNAVELVEVSKADTLAERQGNLKMPNIYILGSPRGTGEYSQQLLTTAGVAWRPVKDAGHWAFIDQPGQFSNEISNFLNK